MKKLNKQTISSSSPVFRYGYVDMSAGEIGGIPIDNINDVSSNLLGKDFIGFYEVLEHNKEAIDLTRVSNGVCKLLDGHPSWDEGSRVIGKVIGSVSNCEPDGEALYGDVEILENDDTAKGLISILKEGMEVPTSIGYRNKRGMIDLTQDKLTIRITDWELTHLAIVPEGADSETSISERSNGSIPAGMFVKRGQLAIGNTHNINQSTTSKIMTNHSESGVNNQANEPNLNQSAGGSQADSGAGGGNGFRSPGPQDYQLHANYRQQMVNQPMDSGVDIAQRNKQIAEYVELPFNQRYVKQNRQVEEAVRSAMSLDKSHDFNRAIDHINTAIAKVQVNQDKGDGVNAGFSQELSKKERGQYSYGRAIKLANGDISPDKAGLENEFSEYIRSVNGESEKGVYTSLSLLRNGVPQERTSLTLGTPASAGNFVQTQILADQFTFPHRRTPLLEKLGAFALRGLRYKGAIPVQTAEAASSWTAEGGEVSETNITAAKRELTPHKLTTTQSISYELLATEGSLEMDNIMRASAYYSIYDKRDGDAINGAGSSNVPTGVRSTTGISTLTAETNGSDLTWARTLSLWKELSDANVSGANWTFLVSPALWAKYMAVNKDSNTNQPFLATMFPDADGVGNISGMRACVSTHVPSNITRGSASNCSPAILGYWEDLVYAEWDSVQIITDPFTESRKGLIRLTLISLHDFAVKRPKSFAIDQFLKT